MTDDKCYCNHVRDSHNQTVVINGLQHDGTCMSCTCTMFKPKASREEILSKAEKVLEPEPKPSITPDQWKATLDQKLTTLREKAQAIEGLGHPLEFVLSVKSILNIDDITLPFAGIVLGPPSSLKTVAIEMLRERKIRSVYLDKFSPKSFVSHSSTTKREELRDVDLLPRIKDQVLLVPELAPIFAAKDDEIIDNLGILTRILDGNVFTSASGVHGLRGYEGEYNFMLLGAAVDIPYKVYKYLSTLGPKLYFFRTNGSKKSARTLKEQIKKNDFVQRRNAIKEAVLDYLKWFDYHPTAEYKSNLPKVKWDPSRDDDATIEKIAKYAILLSHLRAYVPTWETKDSGSQGLNYHYGLAQIEEPDRANQQLYNLARGHALFLGRNYIIPDDLALVRAVVFSTAVAERVRAFRILVAQNGTVEVGDLASSLNVTLPTAEGHGGIQCVGNSRREHG